jgi:hypothetical protein
MKINPHAQIRLESCFGIPVLYVEDFYADPDAVRAEALAAHYDTSIAYYPGRHATIEASRIAPVVGAIARLATKLGDRVLDPQDFFSDFSIVTTQPGDLLPTQQHPHIDPTPVLGLVYLTPNSEEGTSFYFNEMLGLALITTDADRQAHRQFLQEHGERLAPRGYDFTSHSVWHRIYTIEPRFNRFVMYPGNVFHAIDIKAVPTSLEMARLRVTQRFIVNATHEKPIAPSMI